jgi:hypothetical protein
MNVIERAFPVALWPVGKLLDLLARPVGNE